MINFEILWLRQTAKSNIICDSFVHCSHSGIIHVKALIFDSIMPFVNTIKRF